MSEPLEVGARVRLVRLRGVAGDALRLLIGRVGDVTDARWREGIGWRYGVRFGLDGIWWLSADELVVVPPGEEAPILLPAPHTRGWNLRRRFGQRTGNGTLAE